MRLPRQDTEPGEWREEIDKYGSKRRYRMIGDIKEYEMTVQVDGIEIPQSELTAYHKRKRATKQARKEAERNRPAPPPPKNCPFADGMQTNCTQEKCALFLKGSCTLAQISDRPPARATEGLQCPLSKNRQKCRPDCALYNKTGCALTAIKTESEKIEK